ncbi:hypothetical protein BESB_029070 [Besnoitia besnoiti]|uniref:Uncharacterized protein n=1 Tax=Besnoitia besnoiti TaxID=94643 RepID=A0A2A9M7X7_BESBE|nr:uncharacterized protein BESB_029070 [Besnoitia besnoiti]PFH31472.1 hypothetical protein BESB_029070 [Besnoitia besnoiti]
MAFDALWIGSGVYVGIGVLMCVILPFILLRPENTRNISKKEILGLMFTLVTTTVVCLWLFWICAYMAQMHPLIYPERPKEEGGPAGLDQGTL